MQDDLDIQLVHTYHGSQQMNLGQWDLQVNHVTIYVVQWVQILGQYVTFNPPAFGGISRDGPRPISARPTTLEKAGIHGGLFSADKPYVLPKIRSIAV